MSSPSSSERTFEEWMTAEGLVRFMRSFQQFGVTSVETLAISKHDDVYLRFNVGIEDASELARFKQLRARAVGCTDVNNSSKSSSDSSASYASPLATDRREQLTRVSSAPARTGRRASTTGAEGVALMQEWLAAEGLSEFADPLDQFGVDSVAALAASQHDDVYLRFNVGLEAQTQLAKFKQLREQAKQAVEAEEADASAAVAARNTNRRVSVGSAMPNSAGSVGGASAHRHSASLGAQEAEKQLEEWEQESLRSLEEQRRRESTILDEADRTRRESVQQKPPTSAANSASSFLPSQANELPKRRSGRSLEAMTSELAPAQENSRTATARSTAAGSARNNTSLQEETLPSPQGQSRRVSWTESTADNRGGGSSDGGGGGGGGGLRRGPPMLSKKSSSFRDMQNEEALPEWLGGADLLKYQPSLEQFGITSVQTLAESTHDDVYLRFNVGLEDPAALARFKNLREMARDCLVEACAAEHDSDDDDGSGTKQNLNTADPGSQKSSRSSSSNIRGGEAASTVPPELAAASAAATGKEEEKRVDPSDGGAYTRTEFYEEYRGYTEWDACKPAAAAATAVAALPSTEVSQQAPAELSALEGSLANSDKLHEGTSEAGRETNSNAGTSFDEKALAAPSVEATAGTASSLPVEDDLSILQKLESCAVTAEDHNPDSKVTDLDSADPSASVESEFEQTAAAAAKAASEGESYEAQGDTAQENEDWANGASSFAKARDAYKRAADLTAKARELDEASGGGDDERSQLGAKKPTAASAMKWRRKATAAAAAFEECKANWL